MFLDEYASFILENRKNGMSCGDIAAALGSQFGTIRGFSERSVRRWCAQQGLVAKHKLTFIMKWSQEISADCSHSSKKSLHNKTTIIV